MMTVADALAGMVERGELLLEVRDGVNYYTQGPCGEAAYQRLVERMQADDAEIAHALDSVGRIVAIPRRGLVRTQR